MQDNYNNYEDPITGMRKLSEASIPFGFGHKKEDGTTVIIRKATLRPQSREEFDSKSKYKLQYTNLETQEKRSCYIPLLLSFNGKLIDVSI